MDLISRRDALLAELVILEHAIIASGLNPTYTPVTALSDPYIPEISLQLGIQREKNDKTIVSYRRQGHVEHQVVYVPENAFLVVNIPINLSI